MSDIIGKKMAGFSASYGTDVRKWFTFSAAAVLGLTGLAKVWSAFGDVKLLTMIDPIFGVQFRYVMFAAAVAEIIVAYFCLISSKHWRATILVAWLATSFLIYRLGLLWIGWTKPCGCLGNITDALHLSPQAADMIIKVLLAYLLIGSYGVLAWQWLRGRSVVARSVAERS